MSQIDAENNGTINWHEFLAATLPRKTFVTDDYLKELYQQFDEDDNDMITSKEMLDAMHRFGIGDVGIEEI